MFERVEGLQILHVDLVLLQTQRELEVAPSPGLCFDLYARAVFAADLALRRSELDYGMSHFLLYVQAAKIWQ